MKRNLKQYMGVCLLLILATIGGHTALAANTWKMAAKELTKNAQANLSLRLENSDAVNAFQFDLALPTGLQLTDMPILNATRSSGHTLVWQSLDESGSNFRCIVYSLGNANLEGNSGELLSIPVLVNSSFTGGTVTLTNLVLTNQKAAELPVTTEIGALSVKKQYIQLAASGLTQRVPGDGNPDATITVTTIPAGLIDPQKHIRYSPANPRTEGVYTVTVSRDADDTYYKVDTTFRMVLVGKDQPKVTAPTASSLNEGQRLAQSILSGGSAIKENDTNSPVPGKFVWLNPEQVVSAPAPDAETVTYTALFIPTDESRYANVEVPVTVTVNPVYHVYFLPQAGGSLQIEGEHADHTYVKGETLKVKAVPDLNYEFVKWIGIGEEIGEDDDNDTTNPTGRALTNPEQSIPVTCDMTISPSFERPKYEVTVQTENSWNGTLTVTCDGGTLKNGTNYCSKGSTILVQAIPKEGCRLEKLTINNDEGQTKCLVTGPTIITGKFTQLPTDVFTIKTVVSGEGSGSIRLFNQEGKSILPGSALAEGSQFTVISVPEPGSELEVLEVSGATLGTDGKYTMTGETTVTAKFKKRSCELRSDQTGTGTITITPQKATYNYGDQVTISATGGDLDRLVVNGKSIENGQTYTIKGDTRVYAKFLDRKEIDPQYINTAVQSYVFNNQYKHFDVWASDIYSYLGFDVSYSPLDANQTAPVNVGDYNVHITREADQNYKAFNLSLPNALKVTKAKMRVKTAPTSAVENYTEQHGITEPAYGSITIEQDANKTYLHKFTYSPTLEDAANYDPVVYYLSTSSEKRSLTVTGATSLKAALRDGGNEEGTGENAVNGYVLVTNGNMVVEDLNAIPQGTKLTLQAIAKPGYTFKGWKIGDATEITETKNPIEDISLESNLTYEPVFEGKVELTATLTHDVFDYTEGTPNVEISVKDGVNEVTGVQLRFFAEKACTTAIEPTNVKNVGTYYVQAYRAEDDKYQKLKKVFSFTIKPVTPSAITWPIASEIVDGESLAASTLIGGNAGSIPGSFAWKEGQTISGTGAKALTVVFTPLDPNYQSCEGPVTLNVLSTTSSTAEKEPVKPSDPTPTEPTNPTEPTEPDEPSYTAPVVAERTPTTAVITWEKVEGASSYKLFLYAKKGDVTPLKTYEFDSKGQLLKASAISFNLTELEEGKAYYVKTVAYNAWGQAMVEKGIELSATPTAIEQIAATVQVTTSKGMIHVELATPLSIRVVTMNGLPLFEQADVAGHLDIPVTNAGVYVVILYKGHEALLQKVIVR